MSGNEDTTIIVKGLANMVLLLSVEIYGVDTGTWHVNSIMNEINNLSDIEKISRLSKEIKMLNPEYCEEKQRRII